MTEPWGDTMDEIFDCVIVGGGPAGLTAALYLARFGRRFLVVDAGGFPHVVDTNEPQHPSLR